MKKTWKKILITLLILSALQVCPAPRQAAYAEGTEAYITESAEEEAVLPDWEETADPEALLTAYAEQALNQQLPKIPGAFKAPRNNASKLSGVNAAVYRILHQHVCSVAAGEENSTEFSVDIAELGLERTSWTKEDLGVSSLTEVVDGRTVVSTEAKTAIGEEIGILDVRLILKVLLADCPYELYWYDKTQNTKWISYGYSVQNRVIRLTGPMVFRFPVAAEYALDVYAVDGSYGATVQEAVLTAAQIADDYRDYADFERLDAYRREICNLVSYDYSALDDGTAYGNPWQIIWVFDGDPATNVVCEGYAKAFQYLCDLSSFRNSITACTVTGAIDSGAHMWNLVTMENGKNYLVDVTNCDGVMSGAPDYLFLAGYLSGSVDSGYVCRTASGSITYVYSSDIRAVFSDDELTLSKRSYSGKYDGEDPCADGHDYQLDGWIWEEDASSAEALFVCSRDDTHRLCLAATMEIETEPANCETDGSVSAVATVTLEGETYFDTRRQAIPALGHDYQLDRWNWADNHRRATAEFVCSNDDSHTASAEAAAEVSVYADTEGVVYLVTLPAEKSPDGESHRDSVIVFQTGWVKTTAGSWYYLNEEGKPATGWQKINNVWYYLGGSGAMQTGWQKINNAWYYFSGSGAMQTGWQKINNVWYYFSGSGAMQTGWQKINNVWYYFSGSGAMQTGWQKINNAWYYFSGSGAMQTGWQKIGGKWYYFSASGAMQSNKWVDGYYLQADGSMRG